MKIKESNAILLRKIIVREYDQLFVFYSESFGKLKLYRKGARRKNSRFNHGIEPYNILKIRFYMKDSDILLFNDFVLVESFHEIIGDYDKFLFLSLLLEMIEKLSPDIDPNPQIFRFINKTLTFLLDYEGNMEILLIFCFIKISQLFGISPITEHCIVCRDKGQINSFSLEGGLCCNACKRENTGAVLYKLNTDEIGLMGNIKRIPFEGIKNLDIRGVGMSSLIDILGRYIKYHFNIELNCMKIYRDHSHYHL